MHRFRCLIAAFLAILVASPLCCCASLVPAKETARHECCGHSHKEKKETACACPSKSPRAVEKQAALPEAVVASLPPPVFEIPPALATLPMTMDLVVPAPPVDTGPSRARLARLQRFLI